MLQDSTRPYPHRPLHDGAVEDVVQTDTDGVGGNYDAFQCCRSIMGLVMNSWHRLSNDSVMRFRGR